MTPAYAACLFCGHQDVSLDCQISVRGMLDADVSRCERCGLLYVNPPPTPTQIAHLYDACYWDPPFMGAREASRRYHRQHRWGAVYAQQLRRISRKGRMLEIGCGPGFFLKGVADHCDWEVEGVDVADVVAPFAREKLGIRITQGRFEDVPFADEQFDVILARDVLEHVSHPMVFLRATHRVLRPQGRLELRVPNGPFDLAPARRAFKHGRRTEMSAGHLLFISPRALRAMVTAVGFHVTHASVHSFRDAFRSLGLWPAQPTGSAVASPRPLSPERPLSEWEEPAPERGIRGTMLYARLRYWRSGHPALPAWLPFGFRQCLVAERP